MHTAARQSFECKNRQGRPSKLTVRHDGRQAGKDSTNCAPSLSSCSKFLDANQDLSPEAMERLQAIVDDEDQMKDLPLELAAVVDIGQRFVLATHSLEGDSPLIFSVFRHLQVLNPCSVDHSPVFVLWQQSW